jgi:surfeit locus 1 family protein
MHRIPILPTFIVLAAVTVMVALGFWQLDRMRQKEALLARYAAAESMSADVAWPQDYAQLDTVLYRHSRIACLDPGPDRPMAGRSAAGTAGWAHIFDCRLEDGRTAAVVMGWSLDPVLRGWAGGEVGGVIAPGPRLVADRPLAGLEQVARPDPRDTPNNHLSYAVQWFLFALTALVIYALALRKRLAAIAGES